MAVLDDAEGCERYSIDPHLQGYGVQGYEYGSTSSGPAGDSCFSLDAGASRAQAQPRGYHSRYSIAGQKDAYGGEPVHVQDHGADEGSTPHAVANWEAFSAADL
ncbi:hypothetical protein B0H14DRAFT_3516930 [Mycena olivaceomarginata]|nr:hypothetical protein B0H14DRAFT_3516930 [Mycena olivaceomarginata]